MKHRVRCLYGGGVAQRDQSTSLTWHAMTGVGYRFDWGGLTLTYRHLAYDQSGDKLIQNLSSGGPEVGVNVRF
jgi:hypothetical protein